MANVRPRLRPSACALVLVALVTGGCRDALTGTLDVLDTMAINTTAGPRQLPPGQYPVKVVASDARTLTLRLESSAGQPLTATLKSNDDREPSGDGRINGVDSGQPFDVTYHLSSSRIETPQPASFETCTLETTETQCRTVTEYDFKSNQTTERWECVPVPVRRRGIMTVSSVKGRSTSRVNAEVLDADSGLPLARLYASDERDRSYKASTHCALPNR